MEVRTSLAGDQAYPIGGHVSICPVGSRLKRRSYILNLKAFQSHAIFAVDDNLPTLFAPVSQYPAFTGAVRQGDVVHVRAVGVAVDQVLHTGVLHFPDHFFGVTSMMFSALLALLPWLCIRMPWAIMRRSSSGLASIPCCHWGLRAMVRNC